MKKAFITLSLFTCMTLTQAQENVKYQKPPKEILELADFQREPSVLLDNKDEQMLLVYRNTYSSLEELSRDELRLGGLRIDPVTNISSRITYYSKLEYKRVDDEKILPIKGLPQDSKIAYVTYSPDDSMAAFTNTTREGVELWVVDLKTQQARRLTKGILNANLGMPYDWFKDGKSLLVKMLPKNKPALIDTKNELPEGPIVSTSDGQISNNRTYQDLLKNKIDERNFNTLISSELVKVDLNGNFSSWLSANKFEDVTFSPDGKYAMVTTIMEPYSYVVPYNSFPTSIDIYSSDGKFVKNIAKTPLLDNLPKGFMAVEEGRRNISWRGDKPATIYWAEALDKGNPENKVEYRDEIFQLDAPFTENPKSLAKTINRFSGIAWGNDKYALLNDTWWNTRNQKTYIINPSDNNQSPKIIADRNYQDVYSNPGRPQMERNSIGGYSILMNGDNIYLFGDGFTPKGQFPFIDELNLNTLDKKRVYESNYKDKVENLISFTDVKSGKVLVNIESPTEYPNYFFRSIKSNKLTPITNFKNPFESISKVSKEVISYKRDDGVELSGTLYLPAGYDKKKKEKLPLLIWAYPTEYKDKNSAGQSTQNANAFTYPYYGSFVYWVTRGYAVLDDASFPIIGEGDKEPNDTFLPQLIANAKAAIDAVDKLGYIDIDKVAVGGHSYGAFMTANLLTHTNLFAAGIARSGAYNRTLTPLGFQSEERNYWDVPEVYNTMSPFMHVDKMKTPLLLIHGEADNNPGTHTMQSERYFQALKSYGAPVRLVLLPKESHGYVAKENILHLLWEQDQWLEKYVKNRKK